MVIAINRDFGPLRPLFWGVPSFDGLRYRIFLTTTWS